MFMFQRIIALNVSPRDCLGDGNAKGFSIKERAKFIKNALEIASALKNVFMCLFILQRGKRAEKLKEFLTVLG